MNTSDDYQALDAALSGLNYRLLEVNSTSRLYQKENTFPVLVDTSLFQLKPETYHYVHYTSLQNKLMHQHQGLLRFLYQDNVDTLLEELAYFTEDDNEVENIKVYGQQRDEHHLDPTPPEYNFALIFERVFSGQAVHALVAEDNYIDRKGVRRFIDYTLKRKTSPIAIELNGERYHHPLLTGKDKYQSQLFKQNSLVSDGYLVYRWSNRGMADDTKIEDQLREYFGCASQFLSAPHYRAQRNISDFELYEHQADTLQRINTERAQGKSTFLVVLPTGTGKTDVFIEDMRQQYQTKQIEKVLVIVPTRELKNQMLGRVKHHLPKLIVGHDFNDKNTDIIIQTSAYTLRHYIHQDASYFDYILVDEAHRAAAHGLRKVLEHFNPKTLVGLTATDERLDKQKLEDIFGSYQVDLTLEQAIEKGIAPPIRAFRLSSNIDLSKVRFNGKDFVKSDLNKTVQVPSRDQLIVDVLVKYFKAPLLENKLLSQGIIFCVDVKHTKRMAALLNKHDLSAASVHGGDRKGVDEYQAGNIRFLCACELLSEGWDAPQTEIVVMARPTMSKVLYTQQLGRGTRKYNGKEALYVIDVVDSYGAAIQPWSLHNLFNINTYMPFANVIEPEHALATDELIQLDGLWEGERRLEPINIFNFEKEYAHLLNDEQLARELFVSTGTIKSWLKKGDIKADKTLPFGNSILNYFAPSKVTDIRVFKGLKERTEASRYDDFFEFLELRDYTFSYKIAFLLSLLKHCDLQGEADLEVVTQTYQSFYLQLLQQFGKTEKDNNPLNDIAKLDDVKYMQRSMLQNPFEKFERKRFIYQCQDLALISFDTVLWEKLSADDFKKIQKQYIEDGNNYFAKLDIELNETFFNHIFNKESIINDATQQQADVIPLVIPPAATESQEVNKVEIPFYEDLKIACGHFKNSSAEIVNSYFIEDGFGKISPEKHFVATAKGNSMNGGKFPIVDGDLLLFEWKSAESAGSISNQTLAIELLDETGDPQYLLRRIVKEPPATYILKANNPDYQDKIATEEMRTFARFIRVLKY